VSTYFTEREFHIVALMKTMTLNEIAKELDISRSNLDSTLTRLRDKIEKIERSHNIAANWKDGRKNPRADKILRRQKDI